MKSFPFPHNKLFDLLYNVKMGPNLEDCFYIKDKTLLELIAFTDPEEEYFHIEYSESLIYSKKGWIDCVAKREADKLLNESQRIENNKRREFTSKIIYQLQLKTGLSLNQAKTCIEPLVEKKMYKEIEIIYGIKVEE